MTTCNSSSPTSPDANQVDRSVYPNQATSPHVLPYAIGDVFKVLQTLGHQRFGSRTKWAIDIEMPIGTPLYAPTAGTVVFVVEPFRDGDLTPGRENFIVVEDFQGGAWDFGHLQHLGAVVEEGDTVTQGQLVAYSGHTGNAGTTPHLHLEIRRCWSGGPYDLCSDTVPATFRNTQPHPCGLQVGVSYIAEPY